MSGFAEPFRHRIHYRVAEIIALESKFQCSQDIAETFADIISGSVEVIGIDPFALVQLLDSICKLNFAAGAFSCRSRYLKIFGVKT